jgi:hypothetical protein
VIIDVAKIPRGEFTPQERINELLVEHARPERPWCGSREATTSSSAVAARSGRPVPLQASR